MVQAFDSSVVTLIEDANNSAAALVNLLAEKFNCFRDEGRFENKKVRFLKRAQILVADLWAAFDGEGYGEFNDIDKITIFAGMYALKIGCRCTIFTLLQTTAFHKCCIHWASCGIARLSRTGSVARR